MNQPLTADDTARAVHALVTETAGHQVTRDIAHLAHLEISTGDETTLAAPAGYRHPAVTTSVVATSREHETATVSTTVAAWPAADGAGVLVSRLDDEGDAVTIAATDLDPEPSDHARAQVNDLVARTIAHMVAHLNAEMQRALWPHPEGEAAEYED